MVTVNESVQPFASHYNNAVIASAQIWHKLASRVVRVVPCKSVRRCSTEWNYPAIPSHSPPHDTLTTESVSTSSSGSVITALAVLKQPLESVTRTM